MLFVEDHSKYVTKLLGSNIEREIVAKYRMKCTCTDLICSRAY